MNWKQSTIALRVKMVGALAVFVLMDLVLLSLSFTFSFSPPASIAFEVTTIRMLMMLGGFFFQLVLCLVAFTVEFSLDPKHEIFPTDQTPDDVNFKYYEQETIIKMVKELTNDIHDWRGTFDKIYVLDNPMSKLFSYTLFFKRIVVLDPIMLLLASKKDLKAFIAENIYFLSRRASLVRILHYTDRYIWFPILTPPLIILVHALTGFISDPLNPLYNLQFLLHFLLVVVVLMLSSIYLRKFHLTFLGFASRASLFLADIRIAKLVGERDLQEFLIRRGTRWEILTILLEEFIWLEEQERGRLYQYEIRSLLKYLYQIPIYQLTPQTARHMAPYFYILEKVRVLDQTYEYNMTYDTAKITASQEKLIQRRRTYLKKLYDKALAGKLEYVPLNARYAIRSRLLLDEFEEEWSEFNNMKRVILSKKVDDLTDLQFEEMLSLINNRYYAQNEKLFDYERVTWEFVGVGKRIQFNYNRTH